MKPGPAWSYSDAFAQAKASGSRVEALGERTETDTAYVNPSGTVSREISAVPIRVRKGPAWADVDRTLEVGADGLVRPRAVKADVAFSNGGSAAFASISHAGSRLSMSWPKALPVPTLDGDTATYSEVLPGVDLVVRADYESFSEVLVVKSRKAAAQAALRSIRFGLAASNGSIVDSPDGGFSVKDSRGGVLFSSPAPAMWDSAGDVVEPDDAAPSALVARTAPSRGWAQPRPGSRFAKLDAVAARSSVTITPSASLLDSASTVYPLYIDPTVMQPGPGAWTLVSKSFPTSEYYKWAKDQGVGRYDDSNSSPITDTKRQYFSFNIKPFSDSKATILTATFTATNVYSGTCVAKPVTLNKTGSFNSATNWSNKPTQTAIESKTFSYGRAGCSTASNVSASDKAVEWGGAGSALKTTVQAESTAGTDTLYLGLSANESDSASWKRFTANAVLYVEYNRPPSAPTLLSAKVGNASIPCNTTTAVASTAGGIQMFATLKDPDPTNTLKAQFSIRNSAGTVIYPGTVSAPKAQGIFSTAASPLVYTFTTTGVYDWKVRSTDPHGAYVDSGWCKISVDATAPQPPVVTDASPTTPKFVGQPVTVNVSRPSSDAVSFAWSVGSNDAPTSARTTFSAVVGATQSFSFTPTSFGPNHVFVWVYDSVGNRSATYGEITDGVYVTPVPAAAVWTLDDDLSDTSFADGNGPTLSNLAPTGDAVRTFGSHWDSATNPGDGSAAIGLTSSGALTTASPIPTTGNLSLAGLAYPLAAEPQTLYSFTNATGSVITVGIELSPAPDSQLRWFARVVDAAGVKKLVRYSDASVNPAQWHHVALIVDGGARDVRLLVNGSDTPQPDVLVSDPTTFTMPTATGFRIGSALTSAAAATLPWHGYVDDVSVYQGAIDPALLNIEVGRAQTSTWPVV